MKKSPWTVYLFLNVKDTYKDGFVVGVRTHFATVCGWSEYTRLKHFATVLSIVTRYNE
jgi:hypothetical protein